MPAKKKNKPPEYGLSAKGNPTPEHLKPHVWKKGQSGNPGGRPKKIRKLTFVDYVREYFDVEIDDPDDKGGPKINREQHLARMLCNAAYKPDGDPLVHREALKAVLSVLAPGLGEKGQQAPFIQINEYHTDVAVGFFATLQERAGGQAITPELILEKLQQDAGLANGR